MAITNKSKKGSEEIFMSIAEKVKGINFKGFGILPKYIMFDPKLTPEAKAAFALLRSYAGDSDSAYPGIALITDQLHIGINRFYHHFNLLLDNNYIVKKQHRKDGQKYANNVYTFCKKPEDAVKGYGIIPKAVMTDNGLDILSKAIYAYMCCFKDAKTNVALINRKLLLYHMNIVESTYYKYFRPLVVMGYITVVKAARNGHFASNIYILNDIPEMNTGEATTPTDEYTVNQFSVDVNTVDSHTNKTPRNITVPYNTTFPTINLSDNPSSSSHDSSSSTDSIDNSNSNDFLEKKSRIQRQAELLIRNDFPSSSQPSASYTPISANLNAPNHGNAPFVPHNSRRDLSPDEFDDVRRVLSLNNGNLRSFLDDNRKLDAAIHILFDADKSSDSPHIFNLVLSCTSQLACNSSSKVGNVFYDRDVIIDKLNEYISVSSDGSFSFDWTIPFISYFSSAIPKYNIKNIFAYTKASILHFLYVEFPSSKDIVIPPVEKRSSSFDIDKFFNRSVEKSMIYYDDDDDDVSSVV